MKNENIEDIITFLLYNIKGRKKKRDDWITIAKKCQEATEYFKSYKKLAYRLAVSPELIRSILKLLELPRETQELIKERKIGMDAAQRIMRIKNPKDQIKVAKIIKDLSAHDARDIIRFAQSNPNSSINELENYKKRVLESKTKTKNIHITIVPFNEETYQKLKETANKQKISLEKLIVKIIEESV